MVAVISIAYVPSGVLGLVVHRIVDGPSSGGTSFEAVQLTPAGIPEKVNVGKALPAHAPDAVTWVLA